MCEIEMLSPIETVSKTAKALEEIAQVLTRFYAHAGRWVRPEYNDCARSFLKISEDVTGFARNLMEFLAPYYYLSFYKDSENVRDELKKQFVAFRSRSPRQWISQIKFSCGEIDSSYSHYCEAWIKNSYGEHVEEQKRETAELLLQRLTTMDAAIVDALTAQVMDPLEKFVTKADIGLRENGGLDSVRLAHDEFRSQVGPVFKMIENALTHLNNAAKDFDHLAKQN
jgi:hypothetical protein